MKKDNKKKTPKRPASTTSSKPNTQSVGNMKKKRDEEGVKNKLPSTGTIITIISIIVGIATIVIPLSDNWKNIVDSLNKDTDKDINNSVVEIIKTFNPNDIKIDSMSSPDFLFVKEFQTIAKNLADCWDCMSRNPSITEYDTSDEDPYEILEIAENRLDKRDEFDNETKSIRACIEKILDYGKQNNINDYIPQKERMVSLRILESKRDYNVISERGTIDWLKLILSCTENPKDRDKHNIIKKLKKHENLYKGKNNLDYINSLFATIIELNNRYMIHMKQMDIK